MFHPLISAVAATIVNCSDFWHACVVGMTTQHINPLVG